MSVVITSEFWFKTAGCGERCTVNKCSSRSHLPSNNPRKFNMQKIVLVALALFAVAAAAPQGQAPEANPVYILKQDSDVAPDGYSFDFETSDGTSRQEKGTLKQIGEDQQALEVSGSYKYVGTDGLTYAVTFVANEHGFQPQEHVEHQQ